MPTLKGGENMKKKIAKTSKVVNKTTTNIKRTARKGGMSKIAAPATGAIIGAAIGTAAGAILTNNEAKKSLKGAMNTLGDYASETIDAIEENRGEIEGATSRTAKKTIKKIKN